MRSHRRTITVMLVGLTSLVTPAVAQAGSLLSGYGGPGQGNQAILGAALLNTPSGGSGGGGSSGSSAVTPASLGASTSAATGASGGQAGSSAGAGGSHSSSHRSAKAPIAAGGSSVSAIRAYSATSGLGASEAAVSSPTLGITAADLTYMLLVLGGLALTGAVTRQLSRRQR
jgi:hypothetical protein